MYKPYKVLRGKNIDWEENPEGDVRKKTCIEIFIYKVLHFIQIHLRFCFDYNHHYICPEFLR